VIDPNLPFPGKIIACGLLPQNLSPGDLAGNCVGARVQRGTTGIWVVTVADPTVTPDNSALFAFPGTGSNLTGGISFGQSTQAGQVYTITTYRNSTGLAFDVPVNFFVLKWPDQDEDPAVIIIP
jgi:hypothetical protein